MEIRFYLDPETREAHIHQHGVTEDEVAEVLRNPGEERRGSDNSMVVIGATEAGRILRVIYAKERMPGQVFVITAYELRGKPLAAYRRRQKRKRWS